MPSILAECVNRFIGQCSEITASNVIKNAKEHALIFSMQSANSDELAFTVASDLCNALQAYRINITVQMFGGCNISYSYQGCTYLIKNTIKQ